jgi:hypothetical protein
MEDLSLQEPIQWEQELKPCVLCEHADDAGSAMAYLNKMDKALGGRTTDTRLAQMILESYNTFFFAPAMQAGETPPPLTEDEITVHFTEHDINPLRQMRKDINRLNAIQDALAPRSSTSSGRITCNEGDAKNWAALQRLKMDLVKQYDICDRQTSRDMPSLSGH